MQQIPANHSFTMRVRVTPAMTATFFGCEIHPLYATFVLVEHSEYAARQVIRPFLGADEDAVGAAIQMTHSAPTPVGWIVEIRATVVRVEGKMIDCDIVVSNRTGVIARGSQQQRVVSGSRLRQRIAELYAEPDTMPHAVTPAPDADAEQTPPPFNL